MGIRFGTDGWRGIIADDFTIDNVQVCVQAIATYLSKRNGPARGLVVGYDTRFASERFARAAAEVLAANSIPVHLCQNATPTPTISFSIKQLATAGAIIITASHNPADYNGVKFRPDYAGAASDEVLVEIQANIARVESGDIPVQRVDLSAATQSGLLRTFDPWPDYFRNIASLVHMDRIRESSLRVVVDPMYGAAMGCFPKIFAGSHVWVKEIHGEHNPAFPHLRAPEPVPENLAELRQAVVRRQAHIGLANDGDADRIALVDEWGQIVDNFEVYPLLLYYLLSTRERRGTVVKTIATSSLVDRVAEHFGIPVLMTGVGFKHIAPAMLEADALMGGEESGGYAFGEHLPERDGILAGLLVLDMLAHFRRSLSELLADLRVEFGTHHYQRQDWPFEIGLQAQVREAFRKVRPRRLAGLQVVNTWSIDGLRFDVEDGSWLLMRLSGTEPLIRVYAESRSESSTRTLITEGLRLLGLVS